MFGVSVGAGARPAIDWQPKCLAFEVSVRESTIALVSRRTPPGTHSIRVYYDSVAFRVR